VNYDHYTDCSVTLAADLVNTLDAVDGEERLPDPQTVVTFLTEHDISAVGKATPDDLAALRALRPRLRAVFTATDLSEAARLVNTLIEEAGALPQLTAHDGEPLHLHFARPDATLAERVTTEVAMGLASVLRDDGLDRFRVCASGTCADVFVDTSRNRSRRFCDPETCGNRAHVAAHRARRRAAVRR
jgi:predicted RNA-binding Zn ribbon-like protein